jgi:hypothetical protein
MELSDRLGTRMNNTTNIPSTQASGDTPRSLFAGVTGSAYFPLPGDVYVGEFGAAVEVVAVADGMCVIETKGHGMASMPVEEFVARAERSKAERRNTPNHRICEE